MPQTAETVMPCQSLKDQRQWREPWRAGCWQVNCYILCLLFQAGFENRHMFFHFNHTKESLKTMYMCICYIYQYIIKSLHKESLLLSIIIVAIICGSFSKHVRGNGVAIEVLPRSVRVQVFWMSKSSHHPHHQNAAYTPQSSCLRDCLSDLLRGGACSLQWGSRTVMSTGDFSTESKEPQHLVSIIIPSYFQQGWFQKLI